MSTSALARISSAEVTQDGSIRIEFKNGRSIRITQEKGQAGREKVHVAPSGLAAGWLEVDWPIGSYSVPTTLTVYRVGKPLKHFGGGGMLAAEETLSDSRCQTHPRRRATSANRRDDPADALRSGRAQRYR